MFISIFSSRFSSNTSQLELIEEPERSEFIFSLGFSAEVPTTEEQSLVMNHRIQVDSVNIEMCSLSSDDFLVLGRCHKINKLWLRTS